VLVQVALRKKRLVFANRCQATWRKGVHRIAMKTLNIQNIVVPIDFSKMSVQAIQIARQLARRFGASIHLAHVRRSNYAADFVAPAFMIYEQVGEQTALEELKKVASECGVSSATCDVLSGAPPFDEICRLAQTISADLVVMPTHGRTGLKHVFLGSTAERIVQHSSCPVLVTREKSAKPRNGSQGRMKTILVPVDFSSCSREGLRYAIAFANEFGAKIILLHSTYLGYVYSCEGTAVYDIPALQKAASQAAERKMRQLVRSLDFGAVEFEMAFTDGSPVIDICGFAKDHDVDLIITSTHGFTGFTHVLIGSIAEQVVRHAPCSVLVVPSHPHVRAANLGVNKGSLSRRAPAGQKPPPPVRARRSREKTAESQLSSVSENRKQAAFNSVPLIENENGGHHLSCLRIFFQNDEFTPQ
jgi:nucleotide-binding universal stress UspA family protein